MPDVFTATAFLTPEGRLTLNGDLLEDLATEALLPAPDEDGPFPYRLPIFTNTPVRITIETLDAETV